MTRVSTGGGGEDYFGEGRTRNNSNSNIGACELLHPVSFAVPGLAAQYIVNLFLS